MVVTSSENGDPSSSRAVNLEVDRYCRDCCLTQTQHHEDILDSTFFRILKKVMFISDLPAILDGRFEEKTSFLEVLRRAAEQGFDIMPISCLLKKFHV